MGIKNIKKYKIMKNTYIIKAETKNEKYYDFIKWNINGNYQKIKGSKYNKKITIRLKSNCTIKAESFYTSKGFIRHFDRLWFEGKN